MGKILNRPFTKDAIRMANTYLKRCSTSVSIREMQIKTIRNHYLSIKMITI